MIKSSTEIRIKTKVRTKVALKTSFSRPRLVNDVELAPQTLPKPVPFT